MVFNPTSPIRPFGRKTVNIPPPATTRDEVSAGEVPSSTMAPARLPRAPSPLRIGSGWKDGMTRIMRPSQDRQHPVPEMSRWSKTTTDTEISEVLKEPRTTKNVLRKKIRQNRRSKDTTNSSPVDSSYDPVDKRFLAVAAAGSDGLQPFDDSTSDESSDAEPVIHRASSVRVARPQIVQHSNGSGGSVPKLYPPQATSTESSMREASSENTEQPQSLAPRTEEAEKAVSPGGPKEALRVLEGQEVESEQLTDFPQPPEPKTKQDNTLTQTILEWPDTPTKLEALDTLPTPMGGFGSLRMPRTATGTTSSSGTYVAAPSIDGLRSNPPTESDKKLSRAISAPVRHSTSRRVMIRPTDLVIGRTSNNHKLFRESIVSTPYPAIGDISEKETKLSSPPSKSLRRARPLFHHAEAETNEKSSNETAQAPEIPLSTKPVIVAAPTPAKSDRFPSPVAPEVLFLDLRLARHPAARVTVEIEVADKTTFDDEQLFTLIRASYNRKLLGVARRLFSARSLSHASMTVEDAESQRLSSYWHGTAAGPGEIDGADFIKHLLRPRCGRRRKMWLLWLRNAQCHESSASRSRRSRMAMALGSSNGVSPDTQHSPVFSFMQTSTHAHSRNNSDSTPVSATASAGRPGSGSGSGSVRIPRMPFQPFRSSTTTTARSRVSLTAAATGPPAVYLHYTFSLWKIVALLALTFFLALFTTAMWILFGLPGRGADQGNGMTVVDGNAYTLSWKRDAQSRVGVGLVMGIVVLGLGLVTEAVWVWASWILV